IQTTSVRPKPILGQDCVTGVMQNESLSAVRIYPNPAGNYIKIDIPEADRIKVELFNAVGQRIRSIEAEEDVTIDLQNEINAIYFINAEYRNKQYHFKFVKQ
ncbi:MAG: T9SS type A sorting domain-containing protein, partial [Prolixibacteraceae bacterium]